MSLSEICSEASGLYLHGHRRAKLLGECVPAAGPGALCVLAPECKSWGRVARGSSGRNFLNPMGLPFEFVDTANVAVGRCAG